MTDLQFYILVAIPLFGILATTGLFIHMSDTMNIRFGRLESRMDAGFERVDARSERVDACFDSVMGEMIHIDNRLTRVEERTGIKP